MNDFIEFYDDNLGSRRVFAKVQRYYTDVGSCNGIAYCDVVRHSCIHDYEVACNAFVQAIKTHNQPLLRKYKFHLLLHLPHCLPAWPTYKLQY